MDMEFGKDTVFLFGAGVSYDAEVPLLGEFIMKMKQTLREAKVNDDQDLIILIPYLTDSRSSIYSYIRSTIPYNRHHISHTLPLREL